MTLYLNNPRLIRIKFVCDKDSTHVRGYLPDTFYAICRCGGQMHSTGQTWNPDKEENIKNANNI